MFEVRAYKVCMFLVCVGGVRVRVVCMLCSVCGPYVCVLRGYKCVNSVCE